jgi:hypothetical protein
VAKVYATVPGAEVWIPPFGTATNDGPCVVPAAVGEELARAEGLRVEMDEAAPAPAPRKKSTAPEVAPKE